jgi:hypothetical protein
MTKYNFANDHDVADANRQLAQLIADKSLAKIEKVSPKRSLPQNSYLHLLLGYFGQHFGYTVEEAKEIYLSLIHI